MSKSNSLWGMIQKMTQKGPLFLVGVGLATLLVGFLIYQVLAKKAAYRILATTFRFVGASYQELSRKVSFPTQHDVRGVAQYFVVGLFMATLLLAGINQGLSKAVNALYNLFPKIK